MKKIFLATISAAIAFAFTACSQEETKVKWTANSTSAVSGSNTGDITDIAWSSGGAEDQKWSNETLDGNLVKETSSKAVEALAGQGDCVDSNGDPYTISISSASENILETSGSGTTLKENSDVNLIIDSVSAKK